MELTKPPVEDAIATVGIIRKEDVNLLEPATHFVQPP